MTHRLQRIRKPNLCTFAGVLLLAGGVSPQAGALESNGSGWEFEAAAYIWGAGIDGKTVDGENIDISFIDIVNNLDLGLMGVLAARKDRWTLFSDIIYLNLEEDESKTRNLVGIPVDVKAEVELKGWIVNAGGGFQFLQTDSTLLSVLVGIRYFWLDTEIDLDTSRRERTASYSGSIWDGIVGLRGKTKFTDKLKLAYYLDVGAGDSDITWQAFGGINYRFANANAVLGYRHIHWDFDGDSKVFKDLDISGPYVGVSFNF